MIVLGLMLIVLAAAAGTLLFLAAAPLTDPVQLEALGVKASVLPLVLLIAGAAVMVLLWLGLVMIRGSVRRKTRRRREAKELERQADREAQGRREAEARAAAASEPAPATAPATAPTAAAPVPAARFADTRERPGDGWADDSPADRRTDAADLPSNDTAPAPTRADRLMGRGGHESTRA